MTAQMEQVEVVGGSVAAGWARQLPDVDAGLSSEWADSLDAVVDAHGPGVARLLLARLLHRAEERAVGLPAAVLTPYLNSIAPVDEPAYPGDLAEEVADAIAGLDPEAVEPRLA